MPHEVETPRCHRNPWPSVRGHPDLIPWHKGNLRGPPQAAPLTEEEVQQSYDHPSAPSIRPTCCLSMVVMSSTSSEASSHCQPQSRASPRPRLQRGGPGSSREKPRRRTLTVQEWHRKRRAKLEERTGHLFGRARARRLRASRVEATPTLGKWAKRLHALWGRATDVAMIRSSDAHGMALTRTGRPLDIHAENCGLSLEDDNESAVSCWFLRAMARHPFCTLRGLYLEGTTRTETEWDMRTHA